MNKLPANKRQGLRFESVFPVILSTEEFGECNAMARNISAGGILIEMQEPMPLGTEVRVHFWMPDSQASIVARGEVKNHYFVNYVDRGLVLKYWPGTPESLDRVARVARLLAAWVPRRIKKRVFAAR